MERRELDRLLARWQQRGLISPEQVDAIVAFEGEDGELDAAASDDPEDRESIDLGGLLSYGGVLVALIAVLGIYLTIVDGLGAWSRFALSVAVATGAAVLSWLMSKSGGRAAADALGFAAVVLVAWAIVQGGEALVWGDAGDDSTRAARAIWLLMGLGGGSVGWVLARYVPAPLAALASASAFVWSFAALGWLVGPGGSDGPGAFGWQLAVVGGFALILLALLPERLRPGGAGLSKKTRQRWLVGALIGTNVAAFVLAAGEAGVYEGLLLPYAIAVGAGALFARSRILVAFAAMFLYEYVGFVVFRTFGGALAAIIVLALVGLGTAVGGMAVQRGLADRFIRRAQP